MTYVEHRIELAGRELVVATATDEAVRRIPVKGLLETADDVFFLNLNEARAGLRRVAEGGPGGQPIGTDTVFRLASLTKPLVTAAAMLDPLSSSSAWPVPVPISSSTEQKATAEKRGTT